MALQDEGAVAERLGGRDCGLDVAFYAATDWDPAIRGVILTGAIAKLPWKARHILIQDGKTGSHEPRRWREVDSNSRSR